MHRGLWPLGRIVEMFAGKDGHVRSAKVSTRSTTLVRPITKWCFLECYTPTQDERTVSKEVPPWYLTLFSGSRPKCPSQRKAGGMNFRRTFHWGRDVKTQNNTIVIFEFRIVRLAVSVISASLLSEKRRAYSFLSMWFDFTVSMLYSFHHTLLSLLPGPHRVRKYMNFKCYLFSLVFGQYISLFSVETRCSGCADQRHNWNTAVPVIVVINSTKQEANSGRCKGI